MKLQRITEYVGFVVAFIMNAFGWLVLGVLMALFGADAGVTDTSGISKLLLLPTYTYLVVIIVSWVVGVLFFILARALRNLPKPTR